MAGASRDAPDTFPASMCWAPRCGPVRRKLAPGGRSPLRFGRDDQWNDGHDAEHPLSKGTNVWCVGRSPSEKFLEGNDDHHRRVLVAALGHWGVRRLKYTAVAARS